MSKMADVSYGPDESSTPLETFADCRRALARTLRRLEKGSISRADGQVLINGYGCLANLIRDSTSDEVLERLERAEARQSAGVEASVQ